MAIIQANVDAPFDFCRNCEKLEIEETRFYGGGEVVHTTRTCRNEPICEAAVKLSRRHEAEWIPCSERLPSEDGRYMVTHKAFSDMTFIDLFYYGKPSMPNCKVKGWCWYRSDDEWGDVVYDDADILAWMPLPKPYKGGEDE